MSRGAGRAGRVESAGVEGVGAGRVVVVGRAAGASEQPTVRAATFVRRVRKERDSSGEIRTCSTLVSLRFNRPLTQSSSSALPTKNAGFCKPMPEAACAILDVVRRERARRVVAANAREKCETTASFPLPSFLIFENNRVNNHYITSDRKITKMFAFDEHKRSPFRARGDEEKKGERTRSVVSNRRSTTTRRRD